jgi:thiol-disulfide isomerase/thioredoxin
VRPFLIAFVITAICSAQLASQEASPPVELSPAEQELVTLMTGYYEALDTYWQGLREFKSAEAHQAALDNGSFIDPNAEYIPRLLEFEAAHRGDDVGLLALWHVFRRASGGGDNDRPPAVGRREAVKRLSAYEKSDLLATVGKMALGGSHEPAAYDAIASLTNSPTIPQETRDALLYFLAAESLELEQTQVAIARWVEALRNGAEPNREGELEERIAWLERVPATEVLMQRSEDAIKTLERLATDNDSQVLLGLKGVDDRAYIVRLIEGSEPRRLADRAAALLFKHQHLKFGAAAPNLEVVLLNGDPWRMIDHRGKVIVVQFSFTGCGPCAEMYPDLADLTKEHGDRLEVLTLMRDETAERAQESVDAGKMTWSISLDGKPGRVTRQWSVDTFPTVYVIDGNGKIAAVNLRGDGLRKKIAKLINADS